MEILVVAGWSLIPRKQMSLPGEGGTETSMKLSLLTSGSGIFKPMVHFILSFGFSFRHKLMDNTHCWMVRVHSTSPHSGPHSIHTAEKTR